MGRISLSFLVGHVEKSLVLLVKDVMLPCWRVPTGFVPIMCVLVGVCMLVRALQFERDRQRERQRERESVCVCEMIRSDWEMSKLWKGSSRERSDGVKTS